MNDTVETINDSDDDVEDDPDWIKTPLQRERRKKVSIIVSFEFVPSNLSRIFSLF